MCTGKGFANKRTFANYFIGSHTDYVSARNMVNPGTSLAHKKEAAEIAERFERALFASKAQPAATALKCRLVC